MNFLINSHKSFLGRVTIICLAYLAFQFFYAQYAIFSVDEFWFAHIIYQYKNGIPYRDFSPYKTILGYYFLLPPMTLVHGLLAPLIYTKDLLACVNAILFFVAAIWLRKFFLERAVLATLVLLICAEFTLTYSANIRIDLLAYWFCLISVLLLLENKFAWAGIVIACGFLISQKALWYMFASDIALGAGWLFFSRDWETIRKICLFNFCMLLCVAIYVVFWAHFSSLRTVLNNVFYEAYVMYKLDTYDSARKLFWTVTLTRSPLFFLLWLLTLISLFVTPAPKRVFVTVYASVIMVCLIPYKQVFPYYMLTVIPAFLVLYSAFFTWVYEIFKNTEQPEILWIGKKGLWGLLFLYIASVIYLIHWLWLPQAYLLIILIPVLLGVRITNNRIIFPKLILITLLFIGIIYPLMQFVAALPVVSGRYQQAMVRLTNALLQDGSDYVAGIELIYNKNQVIPGMRHLDAPAIDYLYDPVPALRPVMQLSSLLHVADATSTSVIANFKKSAVKFYVNNYRMEALPSVIKDYLAAQYEHYWGSIYIYAPQIAAGNQTERIKFSGDYQIESVVPVNINGKWNPPHGKIHIARGIYQFNSTQHFRLKMLPENMGNLLDPRFQADQWKAMLG